MINKKSFLLLLLLYYEFACTTFTIWQFCPFNFYGRTSLLFQTLSNMPNNLFIESSHWNKFQTNLFESVLLRTYKTCQRGPFFTTKQCISNWKHLWRIWRILCLMGWKGSYSLYQRIHAAWLGVVSTHKRAVLFVCLRLPSFYCKAI